MGQAIVSDLLQNGHARHEIDEDATIADAIDVMKSGHANCLLVRSSDSDRLGVLSEHDIVQAFAKDGDNANTSYIEDYMTPDVIVVNEHETVENVIGLMIQKNIRHIPVLKDDNNVAGFVSIMELLRAQAGLSP